VNCQLTLVWSAFRFVIKSVNFGLESWKIRNAAIETLAREGGEFNFRSPLSTSREKSDSQQALLFAVSNYLNLIHMKSSIFVYGWGTLSVVSLMS